MLRIARYNTFFNQAASVPGRSSKRDLGPQAASRLLARRPRDKRRAAKRERGHTILAQVWRGRRRNHRAMLGTPTTFRPGPLRGEIRVPGDKSISHRALIAATAARAAVPIRNLNPGRDVRATLEALSALGTDIACDGETTTVRGEGLRESAAPLDCMNSGSTARMLLGACAGANVSASFDGDASLRRRPMEPVAAQLRAFGARIETQAGTLPMRVFGTPQVQTRDFILLAPSAQVKSALLFAALFARQAITIVGDARSRDHTERLLRHLGATIEWDGRTIALQRTELTSRPIDVPGDFSSAAFFIVAATVTPGSAIVVRDVGINPTRTGLLDALAEMGARIELRNQGDVAGEPVADIAVEHAALRGTAVAPDLVPRAIDEIPLLAVAAAFADGRTTVSGVRDLRTKESDRIAAIERLLEGVGIAVETTPTAFAVTGGAPRATGTVVATQHDHRTAMAAAVLGCAAGPLAIDSDASINVSFPSFVAELESVRV